MSHFSSKLSPSIVERIIKLIIEVIFISRLLINESPLLILPSLAKEIGLNEAIVLQQMHFWISKEKHFEDNRYWVYNTYDGWANQFPFWSRSTVIRTINSLEKRGIVETDNFNKMKIDQTKWYTINYKKLMEIDSDILN